MNNVLLFKDHCRELRSFSKFFTSSLLLLFSFYTASSATFTVTNLSPGRGSVNSLEWAIDQANYSSPGPDIIQFDPNLGSGTYLQLTVNQDLNVIGSIQILGNTAKGGKVIIKPSTSLQDDCFKLLGNPGWTSSDFTTESVFRNLDIQGFTNQGIFAADVFAGIRIVGCNFSGTPLMGAYGVGDQHGVKLIACDNIIIGTSSEPNTFTNFGQHGMYLENCNTITVENNTSFANNLNGFMFKGCSFVLIKGNTAYNNGITTDRDGIFVETSSNVDILDNTSYNNGKDGFLVQNSSTVNFGNSTLGNISYGNDNQGIWSTNTTNLIIENFEAYNNGINGIQVVRTTSPIIRNNLVYGNTQNGIYSEQNAGGSISGNRVRSNGLEGIFANQASNFLTITSNIVGLLDDGVTCAGNVGDGIKVGGSTDVTVGGTGSLRNITACNKNGIWIGGAEPISPQTTRVISNRVNVYGNYVGTDVTGLVSRPNVDHQVRIDDAHNVNIGGTTKDLGNLIGGRSDKNGVHINSETWWATQGQDKVVIQNNMIGVNLNGTIAFPNDAGIYVGDVNSRLKSGVKILNNLISGNATHGIEIFATTLANTIQGNIIGLNLAGTGALPNSQDGINLARSNNNIIGGLTAGQENIISRNVRDGIRLLNTSKSNSIIGNIIENNLNGVLIADAPSEFNKISRNKFSCNTVKAINLNNTPSVGIGNRNKVTPTINIASSSTNLFGTATAGDLVEIYERGDCFTNGTCSAENYQMQGKTYVGSTTANASGQWSFTITKAPSNFTVTSTNTVNSTSEFAICSCTTPTFTVSKTEPTSCDVPNGSITFTPSGATPLYSLATYNLTYTNPALVGPISITTNASGVYTIPNLGEGTYGSLKLSVLNCSTTNPGSISLTNPVISISTAKSNPTTCEGTDGSITISGLTASTSYVVNYKFDGNAVTPITATSSATGTILLPNLVDGAYTEITATNSGCISNKSSQTLTDPVTPNISSSSSTDPTTCEGTDGTITLNGLTPSTSFTINYLFNSTAATPLTLTSNASGVISIPNLIEGNYTEIEVSRVGCESNLVSQELEDPVTPNISSSSSSDPTTCGGTNGTITLNGLTPSTSFTINYLFNGLSATPLTLSSNASGVINIPNLIEGNYTEIEVSRVGCESNLVSQELEDPVTPNISNSSSTNPTTCGGTDGTITLEGLTPSTSYSVNYLLDGNAAATKTLSSNASGILEITDLVQGAYTNITVTRVGCESNPVSETLEDPNAPNISDVSSTDPSTCSGTDGTITLEGLTPATSYLVNYKLDGFSVTPVTLVSDGSGNIEITALSQGTYTEIKVTSDGCTSNAVLANLEDPESPIINSKLFSNPTSCGGTDGSISLGTFTPLTDYTVDYDYNGSAVSSMLLTSTASGILDLSTLASGDYTNIVVTQFGCSSLPESESLSDPGTPVISTESTNPTTCAGSDGSISINGLTPSTEYVVNYKFNGTDVTPLTFTSSAAGIIVLPNLVEGAYTNITVSNSGCLSNTESETLSDPVTPAISSSSSTGPTTCNGTDGTISLEGLTPSTSYTVSYKFDGVDATPLVLTSNTSGIVVMTDLVKGEYTEISVSSVGCESNMVAETLVDPVTAVISTDALNPNCGGSDGSITISGLVASTEYKVNYSFDGVPVSEMSRTSTLDATIVLSGLEAGEYTNITVSSTGCLSNASSETLSTVIVSDISLTSINPTKDNETGGSILIAGLNPSTEYELSYDLDGVPVVSTIIATDTGTYQMSNLSKGNYTNIMVSLDGCTSNTLSIQLLLGNTPPVAVDDIDNKTDYQEEIVVKVLDNDYDLDGDEIDSTSVRIVTPPRNGTVSVDPITGEITYTPNSGFQGDDSFEYEFLDIFGSVSNVATVIVTVGPRPPMEIYEAVTPNDDGINDYFKINNIEYYPKTNVQIFNRWGNLVWELPESCDGYQNDASSECSFTGNSNVGLGSGGEVPDGTYFYVVDGSADGVDPCQGYLVKN